MERMNTDSVVEQVNSIAKQAWKAHPASQSANLGDKIAAFLAVEDLVQMLITHKSPAPQISNNQSVNNYYRESC